MVSKRLVLGCRQIKINVNRFGLQFVISITTCKNTFQ